MTISATKLAQLVVELGTAMETIDEQFATIQQLRDSLAGAEAKSTKFEQQSAKRAQEAAALRIQVADQQALISRLQASLSQSQDRCTQLEAQIGEQRREVERCAGRADEIIRRSHSVATSPSLRPVDLSCDGPPSSLGLSHKSPSVDYASRHVANDLKRQEGTRPTRTYVYEENPRKAATAPPHNIRLQVAELQKLYSSNLSNPHRSQGLAASELDV